MSEQGKLHAPTFGKVPPELMHDMSITDGAVRLYAHMHWRYGSNHDNHEGQKSMAKYLGVSTATISKRIEELEAKDWIVTIHREYNRKTGNFSTPFYHVFVAQSECREFRNTYELCEGEMLYEQPLPLERKSRKGVGGKPSNLNRANSSLDGRANSSSHGGTNSSSDGHANSSSHNPDSYDLDPIDPDSVIKEKAITPFNAMKEAIRIAHGWDKPTDTEWGQIQKAAKQLLEVDTAIEDIPALYAYCKSKADGESFTPIYLTSKVSEWKKNRPAKVIPDNPIQTPATPPADDAPATPEQIEIAKQAMQKMLAATKTGYKPPQPESEVA